MLRAIIPAAGYGTRMGMRPDQSKEMLTDPERPGQPIIQWCLDRCKEIRAEPLVVVRKEKKDLIQYLMDEGILFLVVEPGKEWADTVLKTQSYWAEHNLLILPDTRWEIVPYTYSGFLPEMEDSPYDLVVYIHKVPDVSKWGEIVSMNSVIAIKEKPTDRLPGQAWGMLRFSKFIGEELFKSMASSKLYLRAGVKTVNLEYFKDITRGEPA